MSLVLCAVVFGLVPSLASSQSAGTPVGTLPPGTTIELVRAGHTTVVASMSALMARLLRMTARELTSTTLVVTTSTGTTKRESAAAGKKQLVNLFLTTEEGALRAETVYVELFAADHGGYTGMTSARLRSYDSGLASYVRVVWATKQSYCIQATIFEISAMKHGPGGDRTAGKCPVRPDR